MQTPIWNGRREKSALMLFLLPGLLGTLVFFLIPFLGGIYFSLTDGSAPARFIGFANYTAVWGNSMFQLGLKNSLTLSLLCAPAVWVMGFFIAALLAGLKSGANTLRNSMLLPYMMPSSAVILIWLLLFDYGGPLNRVLNSLGLGRVNFLFGGAMRLPVVLLFIWKNLGLAVLIYLSAMQAVPEALYEYARLEGAGFFRQCFSITLPYILPTAFLVLILQWVNAFKIFKEVYFIGGAYPELEVYTLQNYINNMYGKLNYQNVTTAAYSFAVIVFAFFGLLYAIERKAAGAAEGDAA